MWKGEVRREGGGKQTTAHHPSPFPFRRRPPNEFAQGTPQRSTRVLCQSTCATPVPLFLPRPPQDRQPHRLLLRPHLVATHPFRPCCQGASRGRQTYSRSERWPAREIAVGRSRSTQLTRNHPGASFSHRSGRRQLTHGWQSELSQSAQLVPLDAHLASSGPASSTWLSLIARPLRWSFSQLRLGVFGEVELGEGAEEEEWKRRQGDWMVRELVEVSCSEIFLLPSRPNRPLSIQRAATNLIPKLPDLHADPVSRLYTLKTLQSTLGPLCLPGVSLSERDCIVLAKHLSTLELCSVTGDVRSSSHPP